MAAKICLGQVSMQIKGNMQIIVFYVLISYIRYKKINT